MSVLPSGYAVRIRPDVRRLGDGELLLGGSPLRATRLSPRALELIDSNRVVVRDALTDRLARRLLDGNLADPEQPGEPMDRADLTVVVPVRDRAEQLDRCLEALVGLPVVVVDDASRNPDAVACVAKRRGARLIVLTVNRGPAGARNAGLAAATTPYVAFVDSDVTVTADALLELSRQLRDPRVALVGPLVRAIHRGARARWFERYEEVAGSLALGRRACEVRPGAAVAWLPSACLVARRAALGAGFSAEMRVGEDVDLVWRLVAEGQVVRYEPAVVALHDARSSVRAWLGRKFVYGSGGADLSARHGDAVAPAVLAPVAAAAAAAVLLRTRWSAPAALLATVWGAGSVRAALPPVRGRELQSVRLAGQGLGWAIRQESALLMRHWWPVSFLLCLLNRHARRAVVNAWLIDAVVAGREHGGPVGPLLAGRRLDDLAYGAGLWWGAIRRGEWSCLAVRWVRRGGR